MGLREVRAGLALSVASIVWTVGASAESIAVGVGARSLVLIAFGAVGVFDAVGSIVLVTHFRHALRHEVIHEGRERVAQLVVGTGLSIVGTVSLAGGIYRLVGGQHTKEQVAGLVVAGLSVVALAFLGTAKRRYGKRIPSRALAADGGLSLIGALAASAALAGAGLNDAFGWWWSDPAAACAIAIGALAIAVSTLRANEAPAPDGGG